MWGGNRQLIEKLLDAGARFLVVGGEAVRVYAPDRVVNDLDVLIDPTAANAIKVASAFDGLPYHYDLKALADGLTRPAVKFQDRRVYDVDVLTPQADMHFDSEFTLGRNAVIDGLAVRVAAPETLLKLLERSTEAKHEADRERLRGLT